MATGKNKKDLLEFSDDYDSDGDLVDIKDAKPAKMISQDVARKQADLTNFRKKAAMAKGHVLEPNDSWKSQLKLWQEADDETRKNYLYGLIFSDGAGRIGGKLICKFFGIKPKELEPYREVMDAAEAALALKIQKNQISIGMLREDSHDLKWFLGKQWAFQTQNPVHQDVEDNKAESGVNFNIKVIGADDPAPEPEKPQLADIKGNFH